MPQSLKSWRLSPFNAKPWSITKELILYSFCLGLLIMVKTCWKQRGLNVGKLRWIDAQVGQIVMGRIDKFAKVILSYMSFFA
jgi:hypothetical protein